MFNFRKSTSAAISKLAKFVIVLTVVLHVFASIWVSLGWSPNSWIHTKQSIIEDNSDGTIYLAAIYWAITAFSTVGYGDITGNTTLDFVFTMIVFLCGICLFSYLLGNVNGLIAQMNIEEGLKLRQAEELEEWLLKLDRVGKAKKIGSDEVEFITKYMNSYWHNSVKDMDQSDNFMAQLAPPLRRRLFDKYILSKIKDTFHYFFDGLDAGFVRRIVLKMEYSRYMTQAKQDIKPITFIKAGKIPKFIYFIYAGALGLYSFDGVEMYMTLKKGSVYGEIYVLYEIPSTYTLKLDPFIGSQQKSLELYKLSAENFLEILKDYEKTYRLLKFEATVKRASYRKAKRKYISNVIEVTPRVSSAHQENGNRAPIKLTDENKLTTNKNLTERIQELDTVTNRLLPTQTPENFTGVFGVMEEEEKKLEVKGRKEEIKRNLRKKESTTQIISGINCKHTNHTQLLILENEYDSEAEYGEKDYYAKHGMVENPEATLEKVKRVKGEIKAMKKGLEEMDKKMREGADTFF